jgi:hypothetical protein
MPCELVDLRGSAILCGFFRLVLRHVVTDRAASNSPNNRVMPGNVTGESANCGSLEATCRQGLTGAENQDHGDGRCYDCFFHGLISFWMVDRSQRCSIGAFHTGWSGLTGSPGASG